MAVASTTGWAVGKDVILSVDAVRNRSFVVDMAAAGPFLPLQPQTLPSCVSADVRLCM